MKKIEDTKIIEGKQLLEEKKLLQMAKQLGDVEDRIISVREDYHRLNDFLGEEWGDDDNDEWIARLFTKSEWMFKYFTIPMNKELKHSIKKGGEAIEEVTAMVYDEWQRLKVEKEVIQKKIKEGSSSL